MTGRKARVDRNGELYRARVVISNRRGLHARAAAKFVKLAAGFDCDVTVSSRGQSVSGRSILGLMMLAAGLGTELEIITEGREASEAIDALIDIITDKFAED